MRVRYRKKGERQGGVGEEGRGGGKAVGVVEAARALILTSGSKPRALILNFLLHLYTLFSDLPSTFHLFRSSSYPRDVIARTTLLHHLSTSPPSSSLLRLRSLHSHILTSDFKSITGELFAIKSVEKSAISDRTDLDSILLEAKLTQLAAVQNPHAANIHAVYEDSSHIHLVLDLCTGDDLFDRISASAPFSEPVVAWCES